METFVLAAIVLVATTNASAAASSSETTRLAGAARVVQDVQSTIPADFWNRARCVAVFPEVKKASFIVGGKSGHGVMSCRAGDRWTAPAFIELGKGNRMFQLGADQIDIVLLVMNEQGVQKLLQDKVTLGGDTSIAAGPIEGQAQVGAEAATAEILSYSRAKGLFLNLAGGVLRPDSEANTNVYGGGASQRTILASRDISAPTEAHAFLSALNAQPTRATTTDRSRTDRASSDRTDRASVAPPSGQATSAPPTPRATTTPTVDDDLRARVVDIQQTLDRMLADTTPGAVGTSGTTGSTTPSGTVTIDRARLMQLRQQLDALMAALNRR